MPTTILTRTRAIASTTCVMEEESLTRHKSDIMSSLTCGERAVRCLIGEPIDRVPFGVGIGWCPWGETLERWRRETDNAELDPAARFGFDCSFALPQIASGLHPPFEHVVLREDEEYVTWRDGKGIVQRNARDSGGMPQFLEYPVKNLEDWERIKSERLRIESKERIEQDWDQFRARIAATGEAVQVGTFPYGVFGTPRDLMGVEELLIALCCEPDLVRDIMDHLTSLWLALWEEVAKEVRIDHIHIWEDMAGKQGALISPAMVREFMMPCYERVAAFAASHGVRVVSVDSDGNVSELVPIMMEYGVNAYLPFEVQAGSDILEYRGLYPTLGIIGGLDKRALAGSRADIDREVERAARMVEKGRYIPGFDHLIPPDVPWENYEYAVKNLRKVCFGGSE